MRYHTGDKPYKCQMCDTAYRTSAHLYSHMRVHTGEKPYKCQMCDKAFSESGNLDSHMRIHTGDKPYKCQMCDKAFIRFADRKRHMRYHTGDKPYKCQMCDKAFSRSADRNRHMRVHTGDKPTQVLTVWQVTLSPSTWTDITIMSTMSKEYHIATLLCVLCVDTWKWWTEAPYWYPDLRNGELNQRQALHWTFYIVLTTPCQLLWPHLISDGLQLGGTLTQLLLLP